MAERCTQDDATASSVNVPPQSFAEDADNASADGAREFSNYASGFWETLYCALFFSNRVFGRPFSGYLDWRALFFVMGMSALIISVQQCLVYFLMPLLAEVLPVSLLVLFFPARLSSAQLAGALLAGPVLLPVLLAGYAAVLHILLLLAQAGGRGYAVTLQCVCFSAASGVLRLIPVSGEFLSVVCGLCLLAVGLRISHATLWHRILPVIAVHVAAVAWGMALLAGLVSLPFL